MQKRLYGSQSFSANDGSNKTFRCAVIATLAIGVSCGGDSGPAGPPAAIVGLSISAPRVRAVTDSATLTWTSQHAASCTASGAWSGSQPLTGKFVVRPGSAGLLTFSLQCVGEGGEAFASVALDVWAPLPVLATSYANFKEVGVATTTLPYNSAIHGYGDFFQDGKRSLFTAIQTYNVNKPIEEATGAKYEFWRFANGTWTRDNSILLAPASTCIQPRQGLVADFNGDGKPDVFIACHGYDAPPFPGERNQVVLSGAAGSYSVQDASPDVGFWHGSAAGDMNGDGKIDVVLAPGNRPVLYINDGAGHFSRDPTDRFASLVALAPWWTVEITDVNEDGLLDVLIGGTEAATCPGATDQTCGSPAPPTVLVATTSGAFTVVTLPHVPSEGLVLDFVVTGTGPSRAVWVNRILAPTFNGRGLQRVVWTGLQSSVPYNNPADNSVNWIVPVTIAGARFIGTDNSRDNYTPIAVP